MKNVSFSPLNTAIETLNSAESIDASLLADALQIAKTAKERAESAWEELRAITKNKFLKRSLEKSATSDTVQLTVKYQKGAMRYNATMLNEYFRKEGIDPMQFKTQDNDSIRITIKNK